MKYNFSQKEIDLMHKYMGDKFYVQQFGSEKVVNLASNGFKEFYSKVLEDALPDAKTPSKVKFQYLSGHDTTIALFLQMLKAP